VNVKPTWNDDELEAAVHRVEMASEIDRLEVRWSELWDKLRVSGGIDQRSINIARTQIETGLMWLHRSLALGGEPRCHEGEIEGRRL
jgi:hypothetical protein